MNKIAVVDSFVQVGGDSLLDKEVLATKHSHGRMQSLIPESHGVMWDAIAVKGDEGWLVIAGIFANRLDFILNIRRYTSRDQQSFWILPNFPTMIQALRKIWAVYGIVVFGIQLLVWTPIMTASFLIFGQRAEKTIIWMGHHMIASATLFLTGVFRIQHNRQALKGKGPFVIVSNHRSFLDILINASAYPGVYKFLSKEEMTKIPVWGISVRRLSIVVDRKSATSRSESMERMRKELYAGFSILLYPEGTRNRTEQPLTDFFDGAFRLAAETGFPIAVMTLHDPRKCCDPRRGLDLSPGSVNVHWDLIEETGGKTVEELKEGTRAAMLTHLQS
jgi:1-acyl-sn-glycerol-3-phosphate acyltransferase